VHEDKFFVIRRASSLDRGGSREPISLETAGSDRTPRHMDVPAAAGGERMGKVAPFPFAPQRERQVNAPATPAFPTSMSVSRMPESLL
jgi:hypothetical protein